jgi:hypothetical protein
MGEGPFSQRLGSPLWPGVDDLLIWKHVWQTLAIATRHAFVYKVFRSLLEIWLELWFRVSFAASTLLSS